MGKKVLVVAAAASCLGLGISLTTALAPSAPWRDGGAGLSYRMADDSGTKFDIRADKDCSLIYTENFFYGKDGTIVNTASGHLQDEAGNNRKLAAGQTISVDLGTLGNGAVKARIGSVTCDG